MNNFKISKVYFWLNVCIRDQDKLVEHSIFQIVQFTGNELHVYTYDAVYEQKVGKHCCGNRLYKG